MDNFWFNLMVGAMVTICMVLILVVASIIASNQVDHGTCLEHKRVPGTQIVMIGKTPITQSVMRNRCVRWEFPEGRPK